MSTAISTGDAQKMWVWLGRVAVMRARIVHAAFRRHQRCSLAVNVAWPAWRDLQAFRNVQWDRTDSIAGHFEHRLTNQRNLAAEVPPGALRVDGYVQAVTSLHGRGLYAP